MADRFAAKITVGGKLPRALLEEFIAAVLQDAPAIGDNPDERSSTASAESDLRQHLSQHTGPLVFSDHEARYGEFVAIQDFCCEHALAFTLFCEGGVLFWKNPIDQEIVYGDADLDGVIMVQAEDISAILRKDAAAMEKVDLIENYIADHTPPPVPPFELID